MTLVVVGLDAADYRLVQEWGLDNLLLDNHRELETFAYSRETPLTSEVWPSIATGRHPEEGGHEGRRGEEWSGLMGVANRVAKILLPKSKRATIGRYLRLGQEVEAHFGPTKSGDDHVFVDGSVYNWPGITPAKNWARSEWWLEQYKDEELTDIEFFRRQMAFTGEELGWATTMASAWLPIVGTRCHVLDHAGHAWAAHPEKLETAYRRVNDAVGTLRESPHVTDIVVCSDHGMQTPMTDDDSPGSHSWHAMVSTTVDSPEPLPGSVTDIRGWLEENIPVTEEVDRSWNDSTMDTPTERLKDLGYIQ